MLVRINDCLTVKISDSLLPRFVSVWATAIDIIWERRKGVVARIDAKMLRYIEKRDDARLRQGFPALYELFRDV